MPRDALHHREVGVVLRAAAVVVEAVGVEHDLPGLAQQPVPAQVLGELPLGVAVALPEPDEDRLERERLPRSDDALARRGVARVLDVPALLERSEQHDVAAVVVAQLRGRAVVRAARATGSRSPRRP